MRWINLCLGFLFFGLGALGAALPVLPTTPLLLLASFFFARSSERFENWFRSTRLYHKYLEDFLERRAMTLPAKIAIQLVGLSAMAAAFLAVNLWWTRAILVALALFELYYFKFRIRTIPKEEKKSA